MGVKFEFSAGGIVFKRDPSTSSGQLFVLVAQHSHHHGWVFPKGIIGDKVKGEGKSETAVREVEEETGVVAKIIKELSPVTYWYQFRGDPSTGSGQEKIRKTVYYFLMEYLSGDIKDHDFEMEKVEWLPIEKVEERLSYKTDKEAFREAKELIASG